jgi:hypothetical protein
MMNNYISSVAVLMTGMFLLSAHVTADNAPEGDSETYQGMQVGLTTDGKPVSRQAGCTGGCPSRKYVLPDILDLFQG